MSIDELIVLILSDPVKALTTIELLKQSGQITADGYSTLKTKFAKVWHERKFGFNPAGNLAKKLSAIDTSIEYQKLKQLIGKHRTLPLVRIGLFIERLNPDEDNSDLVNQIRSEIYEKHRTLGLRIVSMGSSGIMTDIINMLEDLEATECSKKEIVEEYEYVLNKYDDIVMFVSSEETEANIELRINQQVLKLPQSFFIVATGNAAKHGMTVIAKMNKEDSLRAKGYMFFPPKTRRYGPKNQYTWTFWRFL